MNPPNRSLIYRISRNGHVMGEYDIDRIVELLDSGEFLWTDLCWAQGMAAWAPLSNLRSEVAAVKAFPAAAAMPTPIAPGRRHMQAPSPQVATTQAAAPGFAGWIWIVGGVTLGVLVGLLTTHLFPNVVTVDRPVEKIVEKIVDRPVEVIRTVEKVVDRPVEVVRMVEKRVEVPAELTAQQSASILFAQRLFDPSQQKLGMSLFKLSDKVKVVGGFEGEGAPRLSEGLVVARVETAFRRQGFKVLSADSKDYPFTLVRVGGVFLENKYGDGTVVGISGSYEIELLQPLIAFSAYDESGPDKCVIKVGNVKLYDRRGTLNYGVNNLYKIPEVFQRIAEESANDLRKAQDN